VDRRRPERPTRQADQQACVAAPERLVDELLGQVEWLWTELQVTRIKAGLDPLQGRPRHPAKPAARTEASGARHGMRSGAGTAHNAVIQHPCWQ
jgi:hypothetical protein